MIWYKSSIQERSSPLGAKMGRGSPVCQQIREKIIEIFKNNVPQRKIGRDLDISHSTVHNIIKRFKESGGISVRKGQGRKPKLNNRDLRSLRWHCIKNRHSSISDITTWAQDYFGKPLSSTTIRSYIHKCQLKLCPEAPSTSLGSEASGMDHHTVETCTVVRWISISGIFWEEWTPCAPDQRRKGSSRLLPATSPKARVCHGMGLCQCPWQR